MQTPHQNEKELETLIQTIKIYSQNVIVEFEIEKCATLMMIKETKETMEKIELPSQEIIWTLGEKRNN